MLAVFGMLFDGDASPGKPTTGCRTNGVFCQNVCQRLGELAIKRRNVRAAPKDTNACMWTAVAGYSKLFLGKDREAVTLLRQAVEINRNYPNAHFWLAAALALVGHIDEARLATEAGLTLNPTFTISRHRAGAQSKSQTFLAQRERLIEGMRMAGLPQG